MHFISRVKQNRKIKGCKYAFNGYWWFEITGVGIVSSEFTKIKGAKIILHVKSPTFKAAKLKGFQYMLFARTVLF